MQGTNKPRACKMCNTKTYCFFKVDPDIAEEEQTNNHGAIGERLCKICYSGFCPKAVSDVMPLQCLFCKGV